MAMTNKHKKLYLNIFHFQFRDLDFFLFCLLLRFFAMGYFLNLPQR